MRNEVFFIQFIDSCLFMFISVFCAPRCKIDSGYITLQRQETGVLAGVADPFVKTRILTVLINFRSHWRKKMKRHTPAAGAGEMASSALNSGKPNAQTIFCKCQCDRHRAEGIRQGLCWFPRGESNGFSLPYLG